MSTSVKRRRRPHKPKNPLSQEEIAALFFADEHASLDSAGRLGYLGEVLFRRAFHHGLVYAMKAIEQGAGLADLRQYEQEVYRWRSRFKLDGRRLYTPPPQVNIAGRRSK